MVDWNRRNANSREASPKYFYLCNEKGDLEGFQKTLKHFLELSVTIWHLPIRERARKKKAHIHPTKENNNNGIGLANKLKWKLTVSKFKSMFWRCWNLLVFFGAIACVNLVLMQLLRFLLCDLRYQCPIWTDLRRLTESVFEVEKTSLTVLQETSLTDLQGTNCLREFGYFINEISIHEFNCNQIPHVLTFWVTSSDGLV